MVVYTKIAAQVFASVNEDGDPRMISEQEVGVWGTEVEQHLSDYLSIVEATRGTAPQGVVGAFEAGAVMIIGDSITRGSGTNPKLGLGMLTSKSIMNATDQGHGRDRGQRNFVTLNMATALDEYGISTTGDLQDGGLAEYCLKLAPGQSLDITGREYLRLDAIYVADSSPGSIDVEVNGVVIANKPTEGGTGLKRIGLTYPIASSVPVSASDVVKLKAKTGSVLLQGLYTIGDSRRPLVYMAGWSGRGYQHFNTADQLDRIAAILNMFFVDQAKVVQIQLGTNNIYSSSHLTPAQLVTQMKAMIDGIKSRVTGCLFNVSVPPIGRATIQEAGYSFDQYRRAIMKFAEDNECGLVRFDLCEPSWNDDLMYDDVHPNAAGHRSFAIEACRALGVPFDGSDPYGQNKAFGRVEVGGFLSLGISTVAVISGDTLNVQSSFVRVDTEAAAAGDNLATINTDGVPAGTILVIRPFDSARNITVKHGTGNIYLNGAADLNLNNIRDQLMLICQGNYWTSAAPFSNGA